MMIRQAFSPDGTVEFFFIRIVTVRHRPYYNTFTVVFMRIRYRLPVFYI